MNDKSWLETIFGKNRIPIIAEIGINHNGDIGLAEAHIDAAAKSGASAVKFQIYQTDKFVPRSNPYYQVFKNAEITGIDNWRYLSNHAEQKGVLPFSSATDFYGLSICEQLKYPIIKISSANITNIPLLEKTIDMGVPIVLSSGASDLWEVMKAENCLHTGGEHRTAVLHCTSEYPCPDSNVRLHRIPLMASCLNSIIGFSDHSAGVTAAMLSTAFGARLIEKHFTIDKQLPGPDHHFSMDPSELKDLVAGVKTAHTQIGYPETGENIAETEFKNIGRRYVVALNYIAKGDLLSVSNIAISRSVGSMGIEPEHYDTVLNVRAKNNISEGEAVQWADLMER